MDQLTLQRNLSILENRYRELREISESRLQSLEAEKAILKQELEQSDLISLQLRQAQEELDLTRQEIQQLKEQKIGRAHV